MSLSHPYVDPLYPSCQKNCQDGQRQQQPGVVQRDQREGLSTTPNFLESASEWLDSGVVL